MVPSGPPTPVGGAQTVAPSALLRTNSSLLGGQGGSIPAQPAFSPLVSPRTQYGNMGVLGNLSNVSSLLGGGGNAGIGVNPSFVGANGPVSSGPNPGLSGSGNMQRGGIGMNAESDALTGIGSGLAFNASPLPFTSTNASAAISSGMSGSMTASRGPHFPNQLSQDLPHPQQLEVQNFQHGQQGQDSSNSLQIQSQHMLGARSLQQFSAQNNIGLAASQQQQLQSLRALSGDPNGPQSLAPLRGLMPVKMEPQVANEQSTQQQMQALRGLVPVKLEQQQQQQQHQHQQQQQQQQQQQITSLRNIPGIKSEPQHSDQSLLLQQQKLLQMSRQSPQQMQLQAAQMNLLQQQQRLLQQQQQQQMFKTLPVQRSALQQQPIQQFQQHNMPLRSAIKPIYEPGTCARRLTQYMYHQRHRPADNSIDFWRKFVSEYFAPHAKKRWCVSLYGNGRQTTGVFPQDVWHCEICNIKPGRGFETTVEVLPRLCKIKYDSGTLEELLYVDMPREYHTASGHIVLDYGKAIQESVFEQLRVVRDGQLRVVFSMDLKICSWEFCARRHEELIPRRLILSQVSQLGTVAQKYQAASQNGSSTFTAQELQSTCNIFVKIARDLAKAMEVPLVNDLGYTKRYVRCLQISEVVNNMKDLIDYSRETKTGPMASLINFPRRTIALGGTNQCQQQQQQQQQQLPQQQQEEQTRSQNEDSVQASSVQQLAQGNGVVGLTNLPNASPTCSSASTSTIAGLIHQNAINTRQDNQLNNGTSPFGNSVQISSAGSSNSLQQSHPNPSSLFPNTVPSAPNPLPQSSIPPTAHSSSANSPANIPPPQPSHSGEVDPDDSQSSVQQIIQEIMMSSQLNAGGNMVGIGLMGNEMKSLNTMNMPTGNASLKGANCLVGNGISSGMGINSAGFGSMVGINPMAAVTMAGIRTPVPGNSVPTLNGRISMQSMPHQDPSMNHQPDMSNRFLSGLGSVNNFNNLQFDWKPSP